MSWTWDEIQREWLGIRLGISPQAVVEGFERVEATFGRKWMEDTRTHGGMKTTGTSVTLAIADMGQRLSVLGRVEGDVVPLVYKLRERRPGAWAELTAMYLLCNGIPDARIELEPGVSVGGQQRKPDFRTRQGGSEWVFVEVAQPEKSEAQQEAIALLSTIASLAHDLPGSYALEVFLRRDPTDEELVSLQQQVRAVCQMEGTRQVDLPKDLGNLFLNDMPAGQVIVQEREEDEAPKLGVAYVQAEGDLRRHIMVRLPFADARAERFLGSESKQLPAHAPGLVMVQLSQAAGALKSWEPLLRRRFQPSLHTRVSGTYLLSGSQTTDEEGGERIQYQGKLMENEHAKLDLPSWVRDSLNRHSAAQS